MTTLYRVRGAYWTLAWLCLAGLIVGCATSKIDWDSRRGQYTYDQAVLDFGPPDRSATLTDGTKVSEWLTYRGSSRGSFSTFGGSYYSGPWIHHYQEPPSPDHYLRLTFGSDGKMKSWQKVLK
jgi:hypothetical protein